MKRNRQERGIRIMQRKTRGRATQPVVHLARDQRREPTLAERKLWGALRGRRLSGFKFRRQHPHGQFVLDFFCVEEQLEVEVDGGIHSDPIQAKHDQARTECLETIGIRVLRFKNDEVMNHLDSVLQRILEAISASGAK